MARKDRDRDDAPEKVMLKMKWWLKGAMLRLMPHRKWDGWGWDAKCCSDSFLENLAALSIMCPCLIWLDCLLLRF